MRTKIIVAVILSFVITRFYIDKTKNLSINLVNPIPEYIEPPKEDQSGPEYEKEVLVLVADVNSRNKNIKSLECDKVTIHTTREGGVPITLWSEIYYKKDKYFRMIDKSRLGKEADIGSNDKQFWFWSRRMKPPTLYYAKHTDLIKVPLRAPLNPLWLMECLNVTEIDTKNAKARKHENYWAIYQPRVSTLGTLMTKMTLIDPQYKRIIGHYLYGENNQLVASNEILEFTKYGNTFVPIKSKMCWQEEKLVMILQFKDVKVNTIPKEEMWTMPDYPVKKDMTKLLPQLFHNQSTSLFLN